MPCRRWEQPSIAVSAEVHNGLALNALRYIDGEFDAVRAQRAFVRGGAATATENAEGY